MYPDPVIYEPPGITMDENGPVALFRPGKPMRRLTGTSLRGCYRTKERLEGSVKKLRAEREQKQPEKKFTRRGSQPKTR